VITTRRCDACLHRIRTLTALLCANLAIRSTNPPTRSLPMAAAKKSSRSKSGRKRSRSGSSGRKRGGSKRATKRSSASARKSPRRRSGRKSSARRKSTGRKASTRKRARSRSQATVARVKRVATGVVHQAADLGERAVDTVTEFVQDRF